MSGLEVLLMLRRYRFLYLSLFIVFLFTSGWLMIPAVLKYHASSTFYLANEGMVNPELWSKKEDQNLLQVSLVQERTYQLAYSDEMMNYLIKKFNLYNHYNIDTTHKGFYIRTVRKLSGNIGFRKIPPDLSIITVYDRNNEVAASIANAIVSKLDQMNKKYLADKLQANINFYESFVKESSTIGREQNDKFMKSLNALGRFRSSMKNDVELDNSLSQIEVSVYTAVAKIQDVTSDLILAKNLYNNVISAQRAKNLPSLVVIKSAYPEVKSKKIMLAGFSILAATLGCILVFAGMYIYHSAKYELTILFGSKLPENTKAPEKV